MTVLRSAGPPADRLSAAPRRPDGRPRTRRVARAIRTLRRQVTARYSQTGPLLADQHRTGRRLGL